MPVRVRPAAPADLGVIVEFNRRLAAETEGKALDVSVLTAGVGALLADPARGFYLVAEDAGEVVGQLMITFEWSDWRDGWFWWLQSVYVRADARKKGVFRALFDEAVRRAREDGTVIGFRLYVENGNAAAQAVYRSLGLEPMGFQVYQLWPMGETGADNDNGESRSR